MGRALNVGVALTASFAAWIFLLFISSSLPIYLQTVLPVLPFWALVSFGSYSLWSIGYALVTFGDCPEAHLSLMKVLSIGTLNTRILNTSNVQEISEAKADLKRRGFNVN
ncbi:dolichol-phosphate mannosyltransferase subunit 3-domain-containing protein [Chytriomyces sp. MP71]|nr:dolichol-phosphate mannosyltransferase subunit 3-domain-containing protein [Chytriomyces sp. MP71]